MKDRPHLDQKRHMKKPSGPRLDVGSARTRPHGREHHDGAVGDLIRAAAHR